MKTSKIVAYFMRNAIRQVCHVVAGAVLTLGGFRSVQADGVGFPATRPGMIPVVGFQNSEAYLQPFNQYAYVYLKAGESLSYEIQAGNNLQPGNSLTYYIYSPQGQVGTEETITTVPLYSGTITATAATEGIWTLRMSLEGMNTRWRFDLNAQDNGGNRIGGRVYTDFLYPYQGSGLTIPFFINTPSGHKYDVLLNGYNGINSRLSSDRSGVSSATNCGQPLYRSAEFSDTDIRDYNDMGCINLNKMFFTASDGTMPASAARFDVASGQTRTDWLNPALATPVVTELLFSPSAGASPLAGNFSFKVDGHIGNGTLQLDLDGDGIYGGANDRSIYFSVSDNQTISLPFDGLGVNGADISGQNYIKAKVLIDKIGEVHFTFIDVEGVTGIKITRTTGNATGATLLYWDDTLLSNSGRGSVTPVKDGTQGVDSSDGNGVHGWSNSGNQWGNNRLIDSWTYTAGNVAQEITVNNCIANAGTISR